MTTVQIFVCVGKIAFAERHTFVFRIYNDESMIVEITPIDDIEPDNWSDYGADHEDIYERMRNMTIEPEDDPNFSAEEDNVYNEVDYDDDVGFDEEEEYFDLEEGLEYEEMEEESDVSDEGEENLEEGDHYEEDEFDNEEGDLNNEEITTQITTFDGEATIDLFESHGDEKVYTFRFVIAKWSNVHGTHLLRCTGRLSSKHGAYGIWTCSGFNGEDMQDSFRLRPTRFLVAEMQSATQAEKQSLFAPQFTLEKGTYLLKGQATCSGGMIYKSELTITLMEDGTLNGSCLELHNPQRREISGTWDEHGLEYTLLYTSNGALSHYTYKGHCENGKLKGKWRNQHDVAVLRSKHGKFEYEIDKSSKDSILHVDFGPYYRVKRIEEQIFPLTPGKYELKGCAIAENGRLYETSIVLQLTEDGKLFGSSEEFVDPQDCTLTGTWKTNHIEYHMKYLASSSNPTNHEEQVRPNDYFYAGRVDIALINGTWENEAEWAHAFESERGTFEFQVVRSHRQWSKQFHQFYPTVFKDVTKLLLLSSVRNDFTHEWLSHRVPSMPVEIWCEVLSYCGYNWFQDDLDSTTFHQ